MTRFSILFTAICFIVVILPDSVVAQKGGRVPGVIIAKAKKEPQSLTQSFVGTVTPIKSSVIGSAVDGRVLEVLFEEGEFVKFSSKGNRYTSSATESSTQQRPALVRLATKSIEIQIEAAKAELNLRKLAYEELKESLPKEIELLKAQITESETQTQLAKSDLDRMEKINRTEGAVSGQELDTARSTFQKNQMVQRGLEIQLTRVQRTKAIRLAITKTSISAQQEEINQLQDIRSKYTIRAPFEGYIVAKTTEVGHWVSKGEDVFQIVQADPIEVIVNVPQSIIHLIHVAKGGVRSASAVESKTFNSSRGSEAEISLDQGGQTLEGLVHSIVPQADLRSRTFPVRIRLKNPKTKNGHLLKAGMITSVRLPIGKPTESVLVKKDALVLNGSKTHVVVLQPNSDLTEGKTKLVPVETGKSFRDWIEVKANLQSGQWVVVEGNERLKEDQSVKVLGTME